VRTKSLARLELMRAMAAVTLPALQRSIVQAEVDGKGNSIDEPSNKSQCCGKTVNAEHKTPETRVRRVKN